MQKRKVHLKPEERDRLIELVSSGYHQANEIKRAYMLLYSNDGLTDEAIRKLLFCSEDSMQPTRIRYLNEGLGAAPEDQPRSGREPILNAQQEAYLIALACSEPPSGHEHWMLELLAQRMLDDEQVETLSPETVRLTLEKQIQTLASPKLAHSRNNAGPSRGNGAHFGFVCTTLRSHSSTGQF